VLHTTKYYFSTGIAIITGGDSDRFLTGVKARYWQARVYHGNVIKQINNHTEVLSMRLFITAALDHTIILSLPLYFVAVVKFRCFKWANPVVLVQSQLRDKQSQTQLVYILLIYKS